MAVVYEKPWKSLSRGRRVLLKTLVVLIVVIATQATGNVYLSRGMRHLGVDSPENGNMAAIVLKGMETPTIWLGISLLLVSFILYAATLSWADLSFILPASSFGYVVNVACGRYFLNESVITTRWVGATLICLGVVFVGRSVIETHDSEEKSA